MQVQTSKDFTRNVDQCCIKLAPGKFRRKARWGGGGGGGAHHEPDRELANHRTERLAFFAASWHGAENVHMFQVLGKEVQASCQVVHRNRNAGKSSPSIFQRHLRDGTHVHLIA